MYELCGHFFHADKTQTSIDDIISFFKSYDPAGNVHGLSPQSSLTSNQVKSSVEKSIKTKKQQRVANDSY